MKRRGVLSALLTAPVWPLLGPALGQEQPPRVAVLVSSTEAHERQAWIAGLRKGLRETGWDEDHKLELMVRWGGAEPDRIEAAANELVSARPSVIVARGARVLKTLYRVTRDVPI